MDATPLLATMLAIADPIFGQGSHLDRIRVMRRGTFSRCFGMDANIGWKTMSRPSWLQKIYWNHFSKPTVERALFKHLIVHPVRSILEIGIGDGSRMQRIAKLMQLPTGATQLRYIGIDEFESASGGRHLSLKQAHQLASQLGFKASLIPGEHTSAIPRVAHKMGASDLVIVDGGVNPHEPSVGIIGAWLNRLAHSESTVIACQTSGAELVVVDKRLLELPIRAAA